MQNTHKKNHIKMSTNKISSQAKSIHKTLIPHVLNSLQSWLILCTKSKAIQAAVVSLCEAL